MADEVFNEVCETYSAVQTFKFKWIVKDFPTYNHKTGEVLRSLSFKTGSGDTIAEWELLLYPNGMNLIDINKDYIGVFLKMKAGPLNLSVSFELSVLTAKGAVYKSYANQSHIFCPQSTWGWKQFTLRSNIMNEANEVLLNGSLTIICVLKLSEDKGAISKLLGKQSVTNIPEDDLSNDLCAMFDNAQFSDVTISVGSRQFYLHKNILASRSKVFDAMFRTDMEESRTNTVAICDIQENVMGELLRYLYTGTAPNVNEMAKDLLAAAEKYALDRLKAICEAALYPDITSQNAFEMLSFADIHNAKPLRDFIRNFITVNSTSVCTALMDDYSVVILPPKVPKLTMSQGESGDLQDIKKRRTRKR